MCEYMSGAYIAFVRQGQQAWISSFGASNGEQMHRMWQLCVSMSGCMHINIQGESNRQESDMKERGEQEVKLLKGNEALAMAAIRCGVDAYFGYPITPQSEIMETLVAEKPWETTGMVVMQAESEVASINMVYGAAATGKKAMTSSSGPGISLMQNGISYLAGANLPCVIVNVMRGGPGLGTISPSQADYYQATRGGGHGDYRTLVLAPSSVQEMADFVSIAFDWAFKYRNPAMILADGTIGQMMEKVVLPKMGCRRTDEEIELACPWASRGRKGNNKRNLISSLELDTLRMEERCREREERYKEVEEHEVRYEETGCKDADYMLVAFGSSARICQKSVDILRKRGVKAGLLRPITLWPFPTAKIRQISENVKGILVVELNAGQMIDDVRLAAVENAKVKHYGRMGGVVFTPEEVAEALIKEYDIK